MNITIGELKRMNEENNTEKTMKFPFDVVPEPRYITLGEIKNQMVDAIKKDMKITNQDLFLILRKQSWNRAKGELMAMMETYRAPHDDHDDYQECKTIIQDFMEQMNKKLDYR